MKGFVAGTCAVGDVPHTKVGSCALFAGTPAGLVFHDKNHSFSMDSETFNQEILAAMSAIGMGRAFPVTEGIVDMRPTGGDVRTQQEGFGPENPNGLNALRETYVITSGGICLYKQLAKLSGRQMRVFLIDNANSIYGTVADVVTGVNITEERFRGYLVTVYVRHRRNTGTQSGAIEIDLFYDAKFEAEEKNTHSTILDVALEGISGLILVPGSAPSNAKVLIACSADDVTAFYGTKLADQTLYKRKDGTAITNVVYANGEITFTPATAGGQYQLETADKFEAATILGVEGENVWTTLP